MKIEIEILDDQLELIEKIRTLPRVIEKHLGKFPSSFPGGQEEIDEIKQMCALLEFKGKKWIFATLAANVDLAKHFTDVTLMTERERERFERGY